MTKNILIFPGDYSGPEAMDASVKVLDAVIERFNLDVKYHYGLLGGAAIDAGLKPLPDETYASCKRTGAILLGAVGGPKWAGVERHLRPEMGLLQLRKGMDTFANLRPAKPC